jgi:DNA polymerase epsilon subunit 1
VEEWLQKRFEGLIVRIVREKKEDLKLPNHLMGHRRLYMQLCFRNVSDLLAVRRDIAPLALANGAKRDAIDAYAEVVAAASTNVEFEGEWAEAGRSSTGNYKDRDAPSCIVDIREFDVPYYLRVAIDNEMRAGLWYAITFTAGQPSFVQLTDRVKRADPVVMAFDIETTKAPLKFPDAAVDQVMMISYMIDGQGYLVTNREIVSEDIDDFEYTPKEGYEGPFTIFNEKDEVRESLLCLHLNSRPIGSNDNAIFQPHPGCEANGYGNI